MASRKAKIGVLGSASRRTGLNSMGSRTPIKYQQDVEKHIIELGGDIVSAGLVDTAPGAQQAGDLFARENVDLILCYVSTYATSSQVLPAVQRRKAPVLILKSVAHPGDGLLEHRNGRMAGERRSLPRAGISDAFARSRIAFHVVTGYCTGERPRQPLLRACLDTDQRVDPGGERDARVELQPLRVPGPYLSRNARYVLRFHHAPRAARTHVEVLEMDDLQVRVGATSGVEIEEKIAEIHEFLTSRSRGATRSRSLSPTRRCSGRQRSPSAWIS